MLPKNSQGKVLQTMLVMLNQALEERLERVNRLV
ncbi:unnamed protein product [Gulo gulo]|uniref:Uncharacterized protein n=1 Tax=Gulo gulo TaxID=48420 RepID=A0A9X9MAI8_GULGU|nr:unnamed protein product [Gulo gulo]